MGKSKSTSAKKSAPAKAAPKTLETKTPEVKPLPHGFKIHPLAMLLPPMSEKEFAALKSDIAANGQRDPVMLYQNEILDGRNRAAACEQLGLKLLTQEFKGSHSDATGYVYSKAVHRNLTDSQKAAAAVHFLPHFERLANHGGDRSKVEQVPSCPKGKSRDFAGDIFGVSGRYVQDAKLIFENDKDLFHRVFVGDLPISQAKRHIHRATKTKTTAEKAKRVFSGIDTKPFFEIKTGDCLKGMEQNARRWASLVIADPPYNIGIDYGSGAKKDKLDRTAYLDWCTQWMSECVGNLKADGSLWLIINDEHAAEFVMIAKGLKLHMRNWVKWYETFGVNCTNKFNRTSRHLLYFVRDPNKFKFNADAVMRKSDRQEIHGDKRANPAGKVWDDVWKIPRLVDNAAERVPGFPTQIPEAVIKPIVAACSDVDDWILDPFTGSGTTGAVSVSLHRKFVGYELNAAFAKQAEQRMRIALAERK